MSHKLINNLQKELKVRFLKCHESATESEVNLYKNLIEEEYKELMEESIYHPERDMKELCDLIWVSIQYANACGYDLEAGFRELMREFDSKFYDAEGNYNPQFREDGKLLKGSGFKKADFEQFFKK